VGLLENRVDDLLLRCSHDGAFIDLMEDALLSALQRDMMKFDIAKTKFKEECEVMVYPKTTPDVRSSHS